MKFQLTLSLFFLLILPVLLFGQQDEELLSYSRYIHIESYSEHLQQDIIGLESSWYCQEERNSILNRIRKSEEITQELSNYLKLRSALAELGKGDIDNCILKIEDLSKNPLYSGIYYFMKSRLYLSQKKFPDAYENIIEAKQEFSEKKDKIGVLYSEIAIFSLIKQVADFAVLKEMYDSILMQSQAYGNGNAEVLIRAVYGIFLYDSNPKESLNILYKGWEESKSLERSIRITYAIKLLKHFLNNQLYDHFHKIFEEIKLDCEHSCFVGRSSIINTLMSYRKSQIDQLDSSIYYDKLALKQRKIYGKKEFVGYSYLNLCSNYLQLNKLEMAKKYLDSSKVFLLSNDNMEARQFLLKYKLKYFEAIGNLDSVIRINSRLNFIDQSIFKKQQKVVLYSIELDYTLRKRIEHQAYMERLKAQKSKYRYLIIIAALLLLILMGSIALLLFRGKRLKVMRLQNFSDFKTIIDFEREITRLKGLFQSDTLGFIILDHDFNLRYSNSFAQGILLSSDSKVMGTSFLSYIDDSSRKDFLKATENMLLVKKSQDVIVHFDKLENSILVSLSISPLYVNGRLESVLIIAIDVTEREKALDVEKEQNTILQTLFNSVTESVILMDAKGLVISINETGAKRMDTTVEEIKNTNYFSHLYQDNLEERKSKFHEAVVQKKAIVFTENLVSAHNLVSIYPHINEQQEVDVVAVYALDISNKIQSMEQINSLRQKVLRSQMNPHFIFNSLNAIQSYILKNDTIHAVKYLNSFAKLIRMILDSSSYDYIKLSKEMDILTYYLELQQLRFGDKFSWEMQVDDHIDKDSILIPAMLAQPFIENAIEHGLQHLKEKGSLKISFAKADKSIVFKVIDNGIGRSESRSLYQNASRTTAGHSTQIFIDRLNTLNKYSGKKITHDIIDLIDDSGKAKGTMVIINIPIIYRSHII